MTIKSSKRLVIDASIARSAGGKEANFPDSIYCRDFLQAVLEICHKFVMNTEIRDEWNRHQSRFATTWRKSMVAKGKLVFVDETSFDGILWKKVEEIIERDEKIMTSAEKDNKQETMRKDFHLIEAAIKTDKIVISLDNKVRVLFAQASKTVQELDLIIWINPSEEAKETVEWLETGANLDKKRCSRYGDR